MSYPRVYIIVLNYQQWEDTRDCLVSLLASSYPAFNVLVIDNNSPNRSMEYLLRWAANDASALLPGTEKGYRLFNRQTFSSVADLSTLPKLTFIQNDSNHGFAAGNNLVLERLIEVDAYVWLLNPDMIAEKNTLEKLVAFTTSQSIHGIVGAEVRSWWGNRELLFYGGGIVRFLSGTIHLVRDQERIAELDYISGSSLFTHASVFKKYGLLPGEYFLYWEETDWCYRARQQGTPIWVCREAICYDKISTVIGKGYLADYYYARNGLLFISKFRKQNIPLALLVNTGRMLKRLITGQWGRARGIYKGTIDFLKRKFHAAQ